MFAKAYNITRTAYNNILKQSSSKNRSIYIKRINLPPQYRDPRIFAETLKKLNKWKYMAEDIFFELTLK